MRRQTCGKGILVDYWRRRTGSRGLVSRPASVQRKWMKNECGAWRVCLPLQHKFGVGGGKRLWSEASAKATPDTRQRGVDAGISGGLTLNFCLSHFKKKRKRFLYESQPRRRVLDVTGENTKRTKPPGPLKGDLFTPQFALWKGTK